jgi:2-dehydro-3-deoxyphosphogluconate aldolase/(4S)-4-hydroxy-2-oxoglutarate aldolase
MARITADEVMALAPVIPVLTIGRLEDAVPLARALVAGGLTALEITLRTDCALAAIERIAGEVEGCVTGAGTVTNPLDYRRALAAGARFVISPGLTDPLLAEAASHEAAYLPGIATASELMRGLDAGLRRFKFFPAEAIGGAPALKALHGPFGEVRFCPTGGITAASAPTYLTLANVACVGGGWVAPPSAIAAGDWGAITELARAAAALAR